MKPDAYQLQLDNWLKISAEIVNGEQILASQRNNKDYSALLLGEIKSREKLRSKFKTQDWSPKTEIIGTFSALGKNPGTLAGAVAGYYGKVEIKHQAEAYSVEWLIVSTEPTQKLFGTGILLNNVFSVTFQGLDGITGRTFTGLVTYEILNDEMLAGTWTGLGVGITGKELLRRLT
jgi:hypothetical protein